MGSVVLTNSPMDVGRPREHRLNLRAGSKADLVDDCDVQRIGHGEQNRVPALLEREHVVLNGHGRIEPFHGILGDRSRAEVHDRDRQRGA
jgi:hypothetical protein